MIISVHKGVRSLLITDTAFTRTFEGTDLALFVISSPVFRLYQEQSFRSLSRNMGFYYAYAIRNKLTSFRMSNIESYLSSYFELDPAGDSCALRYFRHYLRG